jgi:RimJ/RimL family protein N-acetyltransferase
MEIRVAKVADWPEIERLIEETGYFNPLDCATLGGQWLVAVRDEIIIGAIWWFEGQTHAYIDYWAGKGIYAGAALGAQLNELLKRRGVRHVHAVISANNERAVRTALKLGMGTTTTPYYNVWKELPSGSS